MFDRELWNEVGQTLRRNKLRSFLTMFGVGWGVFMLVIMLGMGRGLTNGVMGGFSGWATNSFFMWTQSTSLPYDGFQRGRFFSFDNADIGLLESLEGVSHVAPKLQLGGWRGSNNVSYGNKSGGFNISGDLPTINEFEAVTMVKGRFINDADVADNRKVCSIGEQVTTMLFGDEDPIGKYIRINGVYFQVVGVFKPKSSANMDRGKSNTIHIPFSTFQRSFNSLNRVHWFNVAVKPGFQASDVQARAKLALGKRHHIHPDDPLAFGGWNMQESFQQMNILFVAIAGISWIVGVLTLLAGVIGIGNIMLVSVRERTKEIGIRRSLGASPWRILGQIMLEAFTLTFLAGYVGLVLGIGLLELFNLMKVEGGFFRDPGVDFGVAIAALIVITISGLLAGYFPARRALAINTVDALRDE